MAQVKSPAKGQGSSLIEKLDDASLKAFNEACKKHFSEQAMFFLNAYWDECGDQAEYIYSVAWECIKKADMRWRNISYIHLYEEGNDLDFDMGLHFFELLCNFVSDPKNKEWKVKFPKSLPEEMTAIVRKKALRDKVDVNFDGRVSFLEYLLYQYNCSPKTLMERSMGQKLPEEVVKALRALEEVNKRIKAYETEKQRLQDESKLPGIKGLKAVNELAQLDASPLTSELNKALITAEAAVRIAQKKYGVHHDGGAIASCRTDGTMWWMNRELEEKKKKYGRK